ncbi:MAG: hypothetical protein IJR14_10785 [Synergistaceae bacterium]|nr:hypothetical protein [Synergistaceae bacterium]
MDIMEIQAGDLRHLQHAMGPPHARTIDRSNTMTIAWGPWARGGVDEKAKDTITVYVEPERYTWESMNRDDHLSVSFPPRSAGRIS